MAIVEDDALTFDDVLLKPQPSVIRSRKEVNTAAVLTKKLKINYPLVSAPMDTVTEANMAIALAREGAVGIIHRFMTIEEQVREILKVKRSEGIVIEKPYTIEPSNTVDDFKKLVERYRVSGLLVTDKTNRLLGIITRKDVLFESEEKKVKEVMTPRRRTITARAGVSIEEAKGLLKAHKLEKLPLLDDQGKIAGLITSRDIAGIENSPLASKDKKGRLICGIAVGVKDYKERVPKLIEAGADFITIDVANGYSASVIDAVKYIKGEYGVELIAGNVATSQGTEALAVAGADCVKIGIGSGSSCITRLVAGVGVPQLGAVMESVEAASRYDVPIMSDGGVRRSGDLVKALAAGASTVMMGNLFAGTEESSGMTIMRTGRKYKTYRGMASHSAFLSKMVKEGVLDEEEVEDYVSEGVEGIVEYKGTVSDVVKQLVGGLRSGMSYLGAKNIKELQKNAVFVRLTDAGITESGVHDMKPS